MFNYLLTIVCFYKIQNSKLLYFSSLLSYLRASHVPTALYQSFRGNVIFNCSKLKNSYSGGDNTLKVTSETLQSNTIENHPRLFQVSYDLSNATSYFEKLVCRSDATWDQNVPGFMSAGYTCRLEAESCTVRVHWHGNLFIFQLTWLRSFEAVTFCEM